MKPEELKQIVRQKYGEIPLLSNDFYAVLPNSIPTPVPFKKNRRNRDLRHYIIRL